MNKGCAGLVAGVVLACVIFLTIVVTAIGAAWWWFVFEKMSEALR